MAGAGESGLRELSAMTRLLAGQRCLIVHIGTGKTGSTSVQRFLSDQSAPLNQVGVQYWGLNLEHTGTESTRFPWQIEEGVGMFQMLSDGVALEQLHAALEVAVRAWLDQEQSIAIWSQEAIYARPQVYLLALREVAVRWGLHLQVIAFARNHYDYVQSAYRQWGLCHKHYQGAVLGFRAWCERFEPTLRFAAKLDLWREQLGETFVVVDYDTCSNVVEEFVLTMLAPLLPAAQCGELLALISAERRNVRPSDSLLLLHAIHNHLYEEPLLPQAFREFWRSLPRTRSMPGGLSWSELLPGPEAVSEICELLSDDQAILADLLASPSGSIEGRKPESLTDDWDSKLDERLQRLEAMVTLLAGITIEQQAMIQRLRRSRNSSE